YLLLGCDVLVYSQFHYTTSERGYFILGVKKARDYAGFGVSQTPIKDKRKGGGKNEEKMEECRHYCAGADYGCHVAAAWQFQGFCKRR
ncbi:MAG: hypothetical protein IJH82_02690, partial [Lachnospiraceae bacterium]|nr:hypothetical protein [Lachnospiraceae bacterium]